MLVTDKNGKQSVQTVNDELGMNSKDVGDVKRRLDRQGVDTSAGTVEMYGGMDTRDKPSSFRRGATRTDNNSGNGKLLLLSLPFFTALYCIVLFVLYCTVLDCTLSCFVASRFAELYRTVLY